MLLLVILLCKVALSIVLKCSLPGVLSIRRLRCASQRKHTGKLHSGVSQVLLAVSSVLMNQHYILNMMCKRNMYTTRLYIDFLLERL